MAGINFDGLPKNLQAKLNEFRFVAKSVDDAIEMAKAKGTWTAADDKTMASINGGANWGKTMDEYAFNSQKAPEYKKETKLAKAKAKVYNVGKSNTQKRAELQNQIAARKEKYGSFVGGVLSLADGFRYNMIPEKDGVQQAGFGKGFAALALAAVTVATVSSCSDEVTEYNFTNNNNPTVNVTIKQDLSSLENILNKMLAKISTSDDTLKALLSEVKSLKSDVNANSEQVKALLQSILAAIGNNTDLLNIVVDGIGQNNDLIQVVIDKLTEGNRTLYDIKELIVKNHESDVTYQQKALKLLADIKTALSKLNADMNANYNNILKAITKQGASLATIEALLRTINANVEKINALVTKYGNEGTELGKAILNAISKLNFNTTVDLSGIEALLKQLVDENKETNAQIKNLTLLFNKFSAKTTMQLNTIISKLNKNSPDYSKQLDTIIKLLEQLDANNETRTQKVLDAIAKLGNDVSADLTAILAAINALPQNEQKDYTEVLNAILDKIKEGNAQNDANFKAVLAKINELGVKVAYGMNAILEAIQNQPDYSSKLDAIIARLDKLGAKAQEILEAIKDHDVKITVDVTGKVTCECNCNCGDGGKHEGIIGDLNDLLG